MGTLQILLLVFLLSLKGGLSHRIPREANEESYSPPESTSESAAAEEEDEGPIKPSGTGVGLGEILGLLFLVSSILYCLGMVFKIFKIIKGTYVEEEPVFLKYK